MSLLISVNRLRQRLDLALISLLLIAISERQKYYSTFPLLAIFDKLLKHNALIRLKNWILTVNVLNCPQLEYFT